MAVMTRQELALALVGAPPRPRLGGADLSELDLSGLALTGAQLPYANLLKNEAEYGDPGFAPNK